MGVAVLGVSVPVIILAPVLQYLLGVELKWLPVSGWGELKQVILPAFALGVADSALVARLTRASLLQVLGHDYIRTARAKGLHEPKVVFGHALKNSFIPIVTVLGPIAAYLLTGTFVVETVFGIPGMGKFFCDQCFRPGLPCDYGHRFAFRHISCRRQHGCRYSLRLA
jgi:ABC-type dipeptide/oligopeptide/nickel transport system permease component